MNSEQVAKYIKSGALILSAFGVYLDPQQIEAIGIVTGLIYAGVGILEGLYFKAAKK